MDSRRASSTQTPIQPEGGCRTQVAVPLLLAGVAIIGMIWAWDVAGVRELVAETTSSEESAEQAERRERERERLRTLRERREQARTTEDTRAENRQARPREVSPSARVDTLVDLLRDGTAQERAMARRQLVVMGEPAVPRLHERAVAEEEGSPLRTEIVSILREILERIDSSAEGSRDGQETS